MNKLEKMVRTHYDGLESGDLDLSLSVFDPAVETVTPSGVMQGVDEFRAFGQTFLDAVSGGRHEVRNTVEVDDTIVVEGTYSGTHTGDLAGPGGTIPATGREFSFPYCDVLQARDDLFVAHRIYWDNAAFVAQLTG
ncbi:ester cyclase [Antrihabitans stalactiti]|nr:ester cyclase [Antrihabitans stalactiti]